MTDKRAVIDIGSNSCLLLIAETGSSKKIETIVERAEVTGLGKGIDQTGRLDVERRAEALKCLKKYSEMIKSHGINPSETLVTATEALRVATDSVDFIEEVLNLTGLKIELISSDAEAELTALGVAEVVGDSIDVQVMDIGGASTELIRFSASPFVFNSSISLPIGSVRATDYLRANNLESQVNKISKQFDLTSFSVDQLVCVAGSMTAIAAMYFRIHDFNTAAIEGKRIGRNEFSAFCRRVYSMSLGEIESEFPILGKRSATIIGGLRVAEWLGEQLSVKEYIISTRGLRHGVFLQGEIGERYRFKRL